MTLRVFNSAARLWQSIVGRSNPKLVKCDDCGQLRLEGQPHEVHGCPPPEDWSPGVNDPSARLWRPGTTIKDPAARLCPHNRRMDEFCRSCAEFMTGAHRQPSNPRRA